MSILFILIILLYNCCKEKYMELNVKSNDTIYNYLRNNLDGKSKNNIKTLLKNGLISVNGKVITKYDYPIKINDIIIVSDGYTENDITLKIIYEDDNIIVIDKPTKILTIGNKKEKDNTLYRKVSDYLKKEKKKVFIIHRLDFDTSGVIMFAKNQKIQKLYQDNWNNIAKKREYVAVVEGITLPKGHIESYLKTSKTLEVYSSKNKDGLFAITDYEMIGHNNKFSLLRILISTGRRNQIRCHMSDIGHPILGDKKYKSMHNPIDRLCLHASILEVEDPLTHKLFTFRSNIPNEFNSIIK